MTSTYNDYYKIYSNDLATIVAHDSRGGDVPAQIEQRGVMQHLKSVEVDSSGTIYINGTSTVYKVIPVKGDSAYEIAVKYGYEGTEEEWIHDVMEAIKYIDLTKEEGENNEDL